MCSLSKLWSHGQMKSHQNYEHINDSINYLKNRIHDLECRVKWLEEDFDKNALDASIANEPKCPDHSCKCPYHPRSDRPPKSPPSGGDRVYEKGRSSQLLDAHCA
ncbi:hypothetical protein BS78_06G091000 [Paspalum vaginatum]|nr:hypothetical protein BS78_06G091000 [Paspalum vaginatum]